MTATDIPVRPGFDGQLAEALLAVPVVSPGGPREPVVAPFDARPLFDLPRSTADDVDLAFETARTAQTRWAGTPMTERRRAMLRFHDLLISHREEGLDILQWESGKPRIEAFKELLGVCTVARHYGRDAEKVLSPRRVLGAIPGFTRVAVGYQPIGVVGVIAPWSYPLYLALADAIPAIMAGNTVVLKPDRRTSLTALWAVDLLHRAGVPRRVLQVVLGPGPDVGSAVVEHADYVAFTGSSQVGATVAGRCGQRLVGCSLGLGAKNPMIVVEDADPGQAAEIAIRACFDNAGQVCMAVERIYVMAGVHDAFMQRFRSRIGSLRMRAEVGWGSDYGSLIDADQLARVGSMVDDAVAKGATVVAGGMPLPDIGPFYYAPTVLTDVTPQMAVHDVEVLGPVVSVQRVGTEEEAIVAANASSYGLNASVLSGDPRRGARIGRRLRTGSVNVNEAYESSVGSARAPMGGMGRSGLGRRNGATGLTRFTEEQTIAVQRGLTFGTPYGMEHSDWADLLTRAFRTFKAVGLK